ncbi:MAG: T9SS type A sorting domain-containing protein [Candidatus Zixiibacteriota bacterium]
MTKRLHQAAVVVAIFVLPSLVLAGVGHQFKAAKAMTGENNTIVVPLEITNDANLTALDIPLTFSEGVELKAVDFEDTRVSYFDFKVANIKNDINQVVIGLLPKMSTADKPDLEAGSGVIARLVFEVTDPSISEVTIEAVTLEQPNHSLLFVYHEYDDNGVPGTRVERPDFEQVTVALSGTTDAELPTTFAVDQNYPNPFNPSTTVSFALPEASDVNLTIYNVLGQEVEVLVNGEMPAGNHTIEWFADNRSSGVYFYRLTANSFSETKKMLLLK